MFERIEITPDDSILGLIEKFNRDPNPDKVDLGVGVYRDAAGNTPILSAVKQAEAWLHERETTKTYTDSHGDRAFGDHVARLVFGEPSAPIADGRVGVTQTPGGSGALRVAAELIARDFPEKSVWMPATTWPNHREIFTAAGTRLADYPYLAADESLDFEAMIDAIERIPTGDVILLHACCHNPTGYDLGADQWRRLVAVVEARELLPLVDFAYQGFGHDLAEDAFGVRLLASQVDEMLVTYSCCKNFGIYRERTGALIIATGSPRSLGPTHARIATIARAIYSSPPGHGSAIVTTILGSESLAHEWRGELTDMRERIQAMRQRLVEGLVTYDLGKRFAHVRAQNGLFSYTGLNDAQVEHLRREYGVYLVSSGRANIAGLNETNVDTVCRAVAETVAVV